MPDELSTLRLQRDRDRNLASLTDEQRAAMTEKARRELQAQMEREVDPDGVLSEKELAKRVGYLRRARMTELSMLAIQARRRKAAERQRAAADAELDELVALQAELKTA